MPTNKNLAGQQVDSIRRGPKANNERLVSQGSRSFAQWSDWLDTSGWPNRSVAAQGAARTAIRMASMRVVACCPVDGATQVDVKHGST